MVPPGSIINVKWEEGWFAGVAGNHTSRGTYVAYNDGQNKYHDLLQTEYVVLSRAEEIKDERTQMQELFRVAQEQLKCSLCLEICDTPRTSPCMHTFCEGCLPPMLKLKMCPYKCDVRINSMRDMRPNPTLKALCSVLRPASADGPTQREASVGAPVALISKKRAAPRCSRCGIVKRYAAQPCVSCREA